jgi:hypothetical protein
MYVIFKFFGIKPLAYNVWWVGEGWGFGKLYIHSSRIAHLAPTRC